jgi:hypothetical protein
MDQINTMDTYHTIWPLPTRMREYYAAGTLRMKRAQDLGCCQMMIEDNIM